MGTFLMSCCSLLLFSFVLALSTNWTNCAPSPCFGLGVSNNVVVKLRHPVKHLKHSARQNQTILSPISPVSLTTKSSPAPNSIQNPKNPINKMVLTIRPNSTTYNIQDDHSNDTSSVTSYRVTRSSNKGRKQHYCGNVLKEVLRLVCAGKYYNGHPNGKF